MYKNVFLEMYKNVFCKFPNVPKCYPSVLLCFRNVHFCTSGSGGVLNVRKCSAMYFNLYSTFPSAICYPFHFTWFLLLLSVPRCHSSEHFAMDLATLQHILTERGLPGIARRAQQHHADKWASTFVTDDHKAEFNDLIDLAIKVVSMRKIFACPIP